jgi:hypothetical protein
MISSDGVEVCETHKSGNFSRNRRANFGLKGAYGNQNVLVFYLPKLIKSIHFSVHSLHAI